MAKDVKSLMRRAPDAVVDEQETVASIALQAPVEKNSEIKTDHTLKKKKAVEPSSDSQSNNSWLPDDQRTSLAARDVPLSFAAEVSYKAQLKGMSVRGMILNGLKLQGFDVPDEELRDGRRR